MHAAVTGTMRSIFSSRSPLFVRSLGGAGGAASRDWIAEASQWAAWDPNDETRAELDASDRRAQPEHVQPYGAYMRLSPGSQQQPASVCALNTWQLFQNCNKTHIPGENSTKMLEWKFLFAPHFSNFRWHYRSFESRVLLRIKLRGSLFCIISVFSRGGVY